MDSLYGGKQGVSFVLRAQFSSEKTMADAFQQGNDYTDVYYGEYCIINTPNKNDSTNGEIFRRGLNYQDTPLHGAELIGQIVGPSSGTPFIQLLPMEDVENQINNPLEENDYRRYPISWNDGTNNFNATEQKGVKIANGNTIIQDENGNTVSNIPAISTNMMQTGEFLVPGKEIITNNDGTQTEKFNDKVEYTWVNVRKANTNSESWFYVGFKIPYLVTEFEARSISPYTFVSTDVNKVSGTTPVVPRFDRIDDKTHEFYHKYRFEVPKGIKGDSLKNISIYTIPAENALTIYLPEALQTTVDSQTGEETTQLRADSENYKYNTLNNVDEKIFIADYYIYDKKNKPDPIHVYLGDYDRIVSVDVSDDGVITFHSSVGKDIQLTQSSDKSKIFKLKYVTDMKLETDIEKTKRIQVKYNTNSDYVSIGSPINYIQDVKVDKNNWHLYILYSDPSMRYTTGSYNGATTVTDSNGRTWRKNIPPTNNPSSNRYNSVANGASEDIYWEDMGAVKDQSGILVGQNITSNDITNYNVTNSTSYNDSIAGSAVNGTGVCGYLQAIYPNGLQGGNTQGKIVAYTPPNSSGIDKQEKEFYAYDYQNNRWFYLGKITSNENKDVIFVKKEYENGEELEPTEKEMEKLNDGGLIVPYEDITIIEIPFPDYVSPMNSGE